MRILVLAIICFISVVSSVRSEVDKYALLTGKQLVAASVALKQFNAEERSSDLPHFTVEIHESADAFEVIFVPDPDSSIDKNSGTRTVVRGGGNTYGRVVHYIVSKPSGEIVSKHYAR